MLPLKSRFWKSSQPEVTLFYISAWKAVQDINISFNLGIIILVTYVIEKCRQVRKRNVFEGKRTITLFHINHWFFFLYGEVRKTSKEFLTQWELTKRVVRWTLSHYLTGIWSFKKTKATDGSILQEVLIQILLGILGMWSNLEKSQEGSTWITKVCLSNLRWD